MNQEVVFSNFQIGASPPPDHCSVYRTQRRDWLNNLHRVPTWLLLFVNYTDYQYNTGLPINPVYSCTSSIPVKHPPILSHRHSHSNSCSQRSRKTLNRSGSSLHYEKLSTRLQFGHRAFSYAAPAAWNTLPLHLQQMTNTDTLKDILRDILLDFLHF